MGQEMIALRILFGRRRGGSGREEPHLRLLSGATP